MLREFVFGPQYGEGLPLLRLTNGPVLLHAVMGKYVRSDIVMATQHALEAWESAFAESFRTMVSPDGETPPLHGQTYLEAGWEQLQALVSAMNHIQHSTGYIAEFDGFTLSYLVSVWTDLSNELRP